MLAQEKGPFSVFFVHKETYSFPVWEKRVRFKYQLLSLTFVLDTFFRHL